MLVAGSVNFVFVNAVFFDEKVTSYLFSSKLYPIISNSDIFIASIKSKSKSLINKSWYFSFKILSINEIWI